LIARRKLGCFALKTVLRIQHRHVSHMAKTRAKPLLTRAENMFQRI
jgi:hypothetical protein